MFQNRRQATLGNINLGSLSAPPTYEDLNFLLEQAARYRGRFVEVSWLVPKTGATFQLTTKYLSNQPQPVWMLYRGIGGGSELIWGHNSNDLTLMHNLVMLECEKPVEGTTSISAGAMDSMMGNTRAAGGIASTEEQMARGASGLMSNNTGGNPRPTTPGQGAPLPANPAATWLQNLSGSPAGGGSAGSPAADQGSPDKVIDKLAGAATTAGGASAEAASPVYEGSTSGELLLDGSLSNITIPKLLRYLHNNKLTGRLALQSSIGAAEIFFRQGQMTHAATLDAKGDNGLLDAATWSDGEFHFNAEDQTVQQTLLMDTRDMITACERMLDISRFLLQERVRTSSFLNRTQDISRPNFEQKVQTAACDSHQLWRLYELADGNHCLSDVLRAYPMTRAEWIPAVYSLINAGLITISDRPLQARPGMYLEGAPIDQAAIDGFSAAIADPKDDLVRRPAFLWMLQQEHYRFERTGGRYALVIFSFATTNLLDGNVTPFTPEMMKEAGVRIVRAKRRLDVVGHFDKDDYALLLPETDSAGAAVFANRIIDSIKKPAIFESDSVLVASFGIASCPDDVRDLSALMAAARAAKSRSKMMGSPVCLYGDQ